MMENILNFSILIDCFLVFTSGGKTTNITEHRSCHGWFSDKEQTFLSSLFLLIIFFSQAFVSDSNTFWIDAISLNNIHNLTALSWLWSESPYCVIELSFIFFLIPVTLLLIIIGIMRFGGSRHPVDLLFHCCSCQRLFEKCPYIFDDTVFEQKKITPRDLAHHKCIPHQGAGASTKKSWKFI